jgi:hypothetical protein
MPEWSVVRPDWVAVQMDEAVVLPEWVEVNLEFFAFPLDGACIQPEYVKFLTDYAGTLPV